MGPKEKEKEVEPDQKQEQPPLSVPEPVDTTEIPIEEALEIVKRVADANPH